MLTGPRKGWILRRTYRKSYNSSNSFSLPPHSLRMGIRSWANLSLKIGSLMRRKEYSRGMITSLEMKTSTNSSSISELSSRKVIFTGTRQRRKMWKLWSLRQSRWRNASWSIETSLWYVHAWPLKLRMVASQLRLMDTAASRTILESPFMGWIATAGISSLGLP